MMFKRITPTQLKTLVSVQLLPLTATNSTLLAHLRSNDNIHSRISYRFSSYSSKPPTSQTKMTFEIQKAASPEQLHSILSTHSQSLNFIHRTVLLQKVTQRPFDQDQELVEQVINGIKNNWKHDYSQVTSKNSRAIANSICYMSRKRKLHQLDQQFVRLDFYQLARFLNPKEFVMTLNGLLKLQLIGQIQKTSNGQFSLQQFIQENINDKFTPSLLVSMWFNLIKYQKSTPKINNLFAGLLKHKHFKNNLIDYMQIVYCYVNTLETRTVDLTYPVITHPKQINPKVYMGAHQLSVLYEQLTKLKKVKDVYFSDEFSDVLENCYLRILNERDIPLRNLANVFNYLVQYENPTSKILEATFHKYFTVLKTELLTLQKTQPNKKPRLNVDSLSFVTLFNQLLEYNLPQNKYLNEMATISMTYIEKIVNNHLIMNEYNERTFIRLLSGIDLTKKTVEEHNTGRTFKLNDATRFGLEKQLIKRNFTEVQHLGKIVQFAYVHDIRSKQICRKIKKLIESIPQENENYTAFQQRLKQKCILNKNCKNCINCFSN